MGIQLPEGLLEGDLTERILAAAFKVHNALGCGFLERVYENALLVELNRTGLLAEQQKTFRVSYEGALVGDSTADLIVLNRVIVECKALGALDGSHESQLMNYLKASGVRVGLLLNFAKPKLQFKRFVA